jgi:hypothetical protein
MTPREFTAMLVITLVAVAVIMLHHRGSTLSILGALGVAQPQAGTEPILIINSPGGTSRGTNDPTPNVLGSVLGPMAVASIPNQPGAPGGAFSPLEWQ